MQCVRVYCADCKKDDTASVIDEINKVCDEFGIKHGLARLSRIARDIIKGKKAGKITWEEKEIANQVGLRLLTMMWDYHYCASCREKSEEKDRKEALRKQFRIVIGKKTKEPDKGRD